ncbi:MAG: L,D-transpeptidase family protein, partial [Pseudomonadota bacterium]|nr:L,D-transpeptidase family protein [Pseudomonadota bacterium]
MTGLRFYLLLLGAFLCAGFALPGWGESDEVQKALAQPEITVGDFDLSKEDLTVFYNARDNKPAWSFAGSENSAAFASFLDSLNHLIDYHGLERENYPLELMQSLAAPGGEGGVKLELIVTDTLLRLAHDLHGDNMELEQLYTGWNFHRDDANIPLDLQAAVAANSLNAYIESLSPKNPAYGHLAQALQTYRDLAAHGAWPRIDPGPALRPRDKGPRIAQLRARLKAEAYLPSDDPDKRDLLFDDNLEKAVLDYQQHNGLGADGHIGARTLEALNTSVAARIDQIRANMERWRHMPDHFPPTRYAVVNIPDATITIFDSGNTLYHGIVIVGRVDRKTPFIQSAIRSMIFNPSWHVPKKIARLDILPKLRADSHYLEKMGFVISGAGDDPYGDN